MNIEPDGKYIYIVTNEDKIRYAPKLDTDEILMGPPPGKWEKCNPVLTNLGFDVSKFRRAINPGDGFELVPMEEWEYKPKHEEYQFTRDGIVWVPLSNPNQETLRRWIIKSEVSSSRIIAFRRPVKQAEGWIRFEDNRPEPKTWIETYNEDKKSHYSPNGYRGVHYLVQKDDWLNTEWTHWKPWTPSPPPPEQKPAWLIEWVKHWAAKKDNDYQATFKAGYDAGFKDASEGQGHE